jgi:hypothetical protein
MRPTAEEGKLGVTNNDVKQKDPCMSAAAALEDISYVVLLLLRT